MQTDDRVAPFLGRLLDSSDNPVGTCFQVSPGVVVTACHVLDTLRASDEGAIVKLDPLRGGPRRDAEVQLVDSIHDLAVLSTTEPLPGCIAGLSASDQVLPATPVVITGVADVDDPGHLYRYLDADGHWAGGTVRDDQIRLGRVVANAVMRGMSGAPVLAGQMVLGVVSARYNSIDGWGRDSVWVARTEDLALMLVALGSRTRPIDGQSAPLPRQLSISAPYAVQAVAFSPDGSRLAVACKKQLALIVDSTSGHEQLRVSHEKLGKSAWGRATVHDVAFAWDGRRFATAGSDGSAQVWDTAGKRLRGVIHGPGLQQVIFSVDGQHLVTVGGSRTARIWDSVTGNELPGITHPMAPFYMSGEICAVGLSKDGQRWFTGDRMGRVLIWDPRTRTQILSVDGPEVLNTMAVSPDGQFVATGFRKNSGSQQFPTSTDYIWFCDLRKNKRMRQENIGKVEALAFSDNGRFLAVTSYNKAKVWERKRLDELLVEDITGRAQEPVEPMLTISQERSISALAFSPDSRRIATAGDDGTVQLQRID